MNPEKSVSPAGGPELAVGARGVRRLLADAEKVVFYVLLVGGIAAPLGAWLWVTVRGLAG